MLAAHFYYGRSGYILAHISMTTRARDFKFAGAIVQRLYLVMVVLTKNRLLAQYGWFCHGRSQIVTFRNIKTAISPQPLNEILRSEQRLNCTLKPPLLLYVAKKV